jgi:hypothetical protein
LNASLNTRAQALKQNWEITSADENKRFGLLSPFHDLHLHQFYVLSDGFWSSKTPQIGI